MTDKTKPNFTWLSTHIYLNEGVYSKKFDEFLSNTLKPLIHSLKTENLIHNYFFIRYAKFGPHIRLRIHVHHDNENIVRNKITDHCNVYFKKDLGYINISPYHHIISARDSNRIFKNNGSIEDIPYEAEYERYGGSFGIKIVEEEFYNSSQVILNILENLKNGENEKLGIGFIMMLECIKIFCHEHHEALNLSNSLCRAYLDAEIGITAALAWGDSTLLRNFLNNNYSEAEEPLGVKLLIAAFNEKFNAQQFTFLEMTKLYSNILPSSIFRQLSIWSETLKITKKKLKILATEEKLQISNFKKLSISQQLNSIAASLIHLNANRLGLHLIEEAWLAYILQRYLEINSEFSFYEN